jgi:flagellar biosynthesis/type III secretory pathway ATPase
MTGKRINIPDQTAWACVVTISCAESTTTIINQALARFSVMLKKEGTASAGTVNTIFDDTTFHNIELTVDTATNTAEHRLKVGLSSGHPHTNLNFIATVEYIQYRRV